MAKTSDLFIFDLLSTLRKNPKKAQEVQAAVDRVDMITRGIKDGKASREDLVEAQSSLIPLCGFNFGLLIPMCFHRYPLDAPLSLLDRPFMFAMTCLAPDSVVTLMAGRQVGKCVDGDTEVLTDKFGLTSMDQLFQMGTSAL